MLTAISIAVLRARESEQKNIARQFTSAALESIFATRDLLQVKSSDRQGSVLETNNGSNWDLIANQTAATPQGIFLTGDNPIRQDSGKDQIEGTADDACASATNCVVDAYTNSSLEIKGFRREIIITNIVELNSTVVRRKKIVVNVKYFAGQVERVETVSTIIADLL